MPETHPPRGPAPGGPTLQGFIVPVSAKTAWVLVALDLADGPRGWGEATAFGAEAELAGLIEGLAASLADDPAPDLAAILGRLHQSNMSLARRALCSALEQAWLSAVAEAAGQPLTRLLGGAHRARVPFYANINRGIADRSPEGFARQAAAIQGATGAGAVKIAPFDGYHHARSPLADAARLIDRGLERVAAVRAALEPGTLVMVDCHARFDPFGARRLFGPLAELGVFWVEEACDMAQLPAAEQRALRGAANERGLSLAGAETVRDLAEFSALLDAGGHDVVLPDLRLTGVRTGMAMLELAAARQVGVSLHNPAGPVLDAVSTHVAAALPAFLILERQVGETPLFDRMRGGPAPVEAGGLTVGAAPGIGFVPDPDCLTALRAEGLAPARLSRRGMAGAGPDG